MSIPTEDGKPLNSEKNTGAGPLQALGRAMGRGYRALRGGVFIALGLWSTLAVYYSNLPAAWMRALATSIYVLVLVWVFVRVRPRWLAQKVFLAAFGLIALWFLVTPPSNDRNWQPDVALLPSAEVRGEQVTIRNIRNCDYRTENDYALRYYDKTFDLSKLRSVDLFLSHWGIPLVAHTMLSFGFEGGDYACFSIEARKEKGEGYSPLKAFFRQYELIYVVGDERDVVRLRTNYRREQVYLYRVHKDMAIARPVFLDYIRQINLHKEQAEWYNVVTANCTTLIRGHAKPYLKNARFDWRILFNGRVDQLAYERGMLDQTMPFTQLRALSLINDTARAADADPAFSARIREHLPGTRPTAKDTTGNVAPEKPAVLPVELPVGVSAKTSAKVY
jgi:hypothetical protein